MMLSSGAVDRVCGDRPESAAELIAARLTPPLMTIWVQSLPDRRVQSGHADLLRERIDGRLGQ
jgi:hypothetical protein